MNRRETSWFSNRLNRDMHILVYGDGGYPLLVFQTQNSKCGNYEDFGMIDTLADYIDGGRIQVFCVDSVDEDSWSNESGDKAWRAWYQESYYHYIIEEVPSFTEKTIPTDAPSPRDAAWEQPMPPSCACAVRTSSRA